MRCDSREAFQAAAAAKGDAAGAGPTNEYALGQGQVYVGGAPVSLDATFRQMGQGVLEEYAKSVPRSLSPESIGKLYSGRVSMTGGPKGEKLAFAFGAQFVEVRVHAQTCEIRVPRRSDAPS